jgi:7-cyano-7-deazaguanine synthase
LKALVVLSGGMDSATALAWAIREWNAPEVSTVSFNYGSKHNGREHFAARALTKHYGVGNAYVRLPLKDLLRSHLMSGGAPIPHGHYADDNMKKTVVPFRNGIMLAVAAGIAESWGAQFMLIGNHAGDHAIYPDCRETFMTPMAQAIKAGSWAGVELRRPFEAMSKADIVKLGAELGVPYQHTYSCYEGDLVACGRCGTCVERLEAFELAGGTDPIEYKDREFYRTVKR